MPSSKAPATPSARRNLFQTMVNDLRDERARLSRRLADIEEELAEYGVRASGNSKTARRVPAVKRKPVSVKRPKATSARVERAPRSAKPGSLKSRILAVLGTEGMRVSDIAHAVLESGYKTKAASLDKSVSVACGELVKSKAVKRTGRGLYAASRVKR